MGFATLALVPAARARAPGGRGRDRAALGQGESSVEGVLLILAALASYGFALNWPVRCSSVTARCR